MTLAFPGHLLGGGSHVAKISGVLRYLEALDSAADEELVLMMDGYGAFDCYENQSRNDTHREADIWFQLRPEVLISRYHAINAQANKRLIDRLGRAVEKERLSQTIIFGAGKRCAPNQVHTVACYPIPQSPLPDDLYGANTDTIMGRNKYTSLRQRYLNSGYIMGPAGDMRKMFRRAWEKVQGIKDHIEWDNGSHGSDFMYHGSDQSIFNTMLGEQEFQREVMRRRHRTAVDRLRGQGKAPKATRIEGTLIDDPLKPKFTHETMEHKPGKPDEFGMGLDYFSELGQQTVNAEEDAQWLWYNRNIKEQIPDRRLFDCPPRVAGTIPEDILDSRRPYAGSEDGSDPGWMDVPLYTNLCLDRIPVMIHHNGDKAARGYSWPKHWISAHARKLISTTQRVGALTPGAAHLRWNELCPQDMEQELYQDVER